MEKREKGILSRLVRLGDWEEQQGSRGKGRGTDPGEGRLQWKQERRGIEEERKRRISRRGKKKEKKNKQAI